MSPEEFIKRWIQKFNAADVDGLVELYAEDAINNQVVLPSPLVGRQAIKAMFQLEFSRVDMVCIEENIYVCGDTAILQWKDPLGLRGCGFFKLHNNQIVHQKGYFDQLNFFKAQGLDEDYSILCPGADALKALQHGYR